MIRLTACCTCSRFAIGMAQTQNWSFLFQFVNTFTAIHDNCHLLTYLLIQFGSLYCKHYGPRSDYSHRSSLTRAHSIRFHYQKQSEEHLNMLRVHTKKYFSYFSAKPYVVGTQKNHLNEMVLLSTQNIC